MFSAIEFRLSCDLEICVSLGEMQQQTLQMKLQCFMVIARVISAVIMEPIEA